MNDNYLVSGPNLIILKSCEIFKSLFSNGKSFIGFGTSISEKASAQVRWLKMGRLDTLALDADLRGQMTSK